ncbi:acyltransferase family protein [Actinobacillus equuli]|uniref:Acyltransferase 3 n=1 Tax=Actinobacillus equuli TaxID=718 RepID=A0AAX3FMS1_ACTEU|nr:acyltransferase [Actinobacillus equuli]AIZ80238.1 acyltransferase [Actinobacillus equuli subsp. equuli]WGE44345.1 acyltransferase [Actinobacillus equuli subsp. equuli]VEE91555.1 acyltransferase 3 [Actinobacillus equuli]
MKSLNINYMTRLDHLRFFAALLVVFTHIKGKITLAPEDFGFPGAFLSVSHFIKNWIFNGSTGVSLFLVLTGFLFCIISDNGHKKIKYSGFIYNRILRIFPMMILLTFIVITVSRQTSTPMDIFRILTLQLNTGHKYTGWGHEFYPSGPIWTIGVEFQFYLLFPFLALFLSKYGVKYLVGLVVLIVLIKYNLFILKGSGVYYNLYHSIIGRLDQFIIGMIFAVIYKSCFIEKFKNKNIFSLCLMMVSLLVLMAYFGKKNTLSFTIEAICWGGVILSYLSMNLFNSSFMDKLLAKLGELSFSIYLLHLPIVDMLNRMFGLASPTTLIDSIMAFSWKVTIVAMIAWLTFTLIEKPFMSLRVKYTS